MPGVLGYPTMAYLTETDKGAASPRSDAAASHLRCERIWRHLLDPGSEMDAPGVLDDVPEQIDRADVENWLAAQASDVEINLANPSDEDLQRLSGLGVNHRALAEILTRPVPRTGPAAARAIDQPENSIVARTDRLVAFQFDIIREQKFEFPCPLSGENTAAAAGFWLAPIMLAYVFRGERPFFVILSTFNLIPAVVYVPDLSLRILLLQGNWRQSVQMVERLKLALVCNWRAALNSITSKENRLAYHVGFAENLAHNLRDDLSGLQSLIDLGLANNIEKIFVGPNLFYGKIEEIFPELPADKIEYIKFPKNFDYIRKRYFDGCYLPAKVVGTFVTRSICDKVLKWADRKCEVSFLNELRDKANNLNPLLGVTIRTRSRSWENQEDGLCRLITELSRKHPRLGVVFDGVNDVADEDLIEEERLLVQRIVERLEGCGATLIDTIGVPIEQSLAWATAIDAYLAPHGAGMTKHHWLAGKPGVVHSNEKILQNIMGRAFGGFDVEESNMPLHIGRNAVRTQAHTGDEHRGRDDFRFSLESYECDWRALERLVAMLLARVSPERTLEPLVDRCPPPFSDMHIAQLGQGRLPPVTLRSASLESGAGCSFGIYVSQKAQLLGLHDSAPIIVFVPGVFQTSPPFRLQSVADKVGAIIISPIFAADLTGEMDEHAYCQLLAKGIRFDLLLIEMLDQFCTMYGVATDRFFLCGGSGGAQFANRFLLAHPDKVLGISLVAPGSVTLPSSSERWWVGLGDFCEIFGGEPRLDLLSSIPVQIIVGDKDLSPTNGLSGRHWLDEAIVQGENRLQRATSLAEDLRTYCSDVRLELVPGAGHEMHRLWDYSYDFLTAIISRHLDVSRQSGSANRV